MRSNHRTSAQHVAHVLMVVTFTVAALYLGRELLIPLAIAALLTFLLSPVVTAFERRRVPRLPAVGLVLSVIFVVALVTGWNVARQFNDLALQLPSYRQNLQEKLDDIRFMGGSLEKVRETFATVGRELEPDVQGVQQVQVVNPNPIVEQTMLLLTTFLGPLASVAVIVVLVIFMLISREDLRNRVVRLAGSRLALTTRTLDEIGTRISRYLLMNAMINGGFGLAVALGLTLIGVEYAVLWGFLAAVLRFVPYVGPILASLMPVSMAFIQFPGEDWSHLVMTIALFVTLELITNNVIEPLLYGASTGVSTIALLISAMFWTWIWGPVGLVLAVPLTVILAVLGEYIGRLEPLAILLGDKPPLAASITYYQRLLASDVEEAATILSGAAASKSRIDAYDTVLIPALALAEKDYDAGELPDADREAIWQTTAEFMGDADAEPDSAAEAAAAPSKPILRARLVGCPAHDGADQLALEMLKQVVTVHPSGLFEILPASMLASEMLTAIGEQRAAAVCISSLGLGGVRQARYLCKRIRQKFPTLRILVARWNYAGDRDTMIGRFKQLGADHVVTTLAEAADALQRISAVEAASTAENSSQTPAMHAV